MHETNKQLRQLIEELSISHAEVAKHLGVPTSTIESWTLDPSDERYAEMPKSELTLLQYALMYLNKNYTLF